MLPIIFIRVPLLLPTLPLGLKSKKNTFLCGRKNMAMAVCVRQVKDDGGPKLFGEGRVHMYVCIHGVL
jgi:hypothetical protein